MLMNRVINFHNLSTSNEGKRLVSFTAIDITKSLPGPHLTVVEQLRNLLDAPTNRKPAASLDSAKLMTSSTPFNIP